MYKTIVLAYDGSRESRRALREGALFAREQEAELHLLSVISRRTGTLVAEGVFPGPLGAEEDAHRRNLEEGVERLAQLGCACTAELLVGDAAPTIAGYARRVRADLVVVGQPPRRARRWWAASPGSYLSDHLECSLMIVQGEIDDQTFDAGLVAKG